jgi:hypothetical protein
VRELRRISAGTEDSEMIGWAVRYGKEPGDVHRALCPFAASLMRRYVKQFIDQ